jgi:hypothetical protein
VLSKRLPGSWPGAKRSEPLVGDHKLNYPINELMLSWEPNIQQRLKHIQTLGDLFNYFAFMSTPLSVNRSILNWSLNHYGLELMFRIPSPKEVLNQQKYGRRCVTIILDSQKSRKYILGERDALGFTMHDLIHADHFYHNNLSFEGQLGFYGLLDYCLSESHFDEHLQDLKFEQEFEYLISDMNAYAIHLLKCFKSALLHYHKTGEAFFRDWIRKLNLTALEADALLKLNTSLYQGTDDQILLQILSRFQAERNLHLP